jgi:5,10-methylenetetrahydrofolate reductase
MATFVDETNKSEKIEDSIINRNASKFISVEFFPPKTDVGKHLDN